MTTNPETATPWSPRHPTLIALALLSAWVMLLYLPAFSGQFLVGPSSDQIYTGVPFRWFGGDEWRRTGSIPLWNPYMFGGLPFVGAMHGDIFYPTAWLRLVLPIDTAMNLGFALHMVLAGLFTYLFLRSLGVSWTGSVAGGVSYQLSGIVASLVQPGHDGKMFVSALFPLMLLALVFAIRRRRMEGFGLFALVVGLGILSPHFQMMQYALIFAGLFALWLAFGDTERPADSRARLGAMGLALGAVLLGVGIAMVQIMPFVANAPFAARTAGAQGWEYATSYAMPPEHLLDWLVPEFTGVLQNYWGSNYFKLHSEYVGAVTLGLVLLGATNAARRRISWFIAGAGLLFLLVCMGGHTPFYRLWYELVPGVKVTRAPGMAFFIPTFLFAVLAAFGVERLERGEGRKLLLGLLAAAGALLLFGASGLLGGLAEGIAEPQMAPRASANGDAIALGAVRSAIMLALCASAGLALVAGKLRALPAALVLALLIGADLGWNARRFFTWSPPAAELYADDAITSRIEQTPLPYRVLDLPEPNGVYRTAYLMGKRIPNALGHHGNELHAYDELLGGKNVWQNLAGSTRLWDLLSIRFVLLGAPIRLPGYSLVTRAELQPAGHQGGIQEAFLYERDSVPQYARVVPAAYKVDVERIVPTLMDPRFDYNRMVLLDSDAPVETPELDTIPPAISARAAVTAWEPGRMTIRLDPAPDSAAWLLISENWYPDWSASVDGQSAGVFRGNRSLITIPVAAGAREVQLTMSSPSYGRGKLLSFAALAAALLWIVIPVALRRRRG